MTPQRIFAGLISFALLVLLGWCVVGHVADLRTQIVLGVGATLGIVYTIYGQVPDWIIRHSGGSLVADDDPRSISPRIYLPIIAATFLLAIGVFVVVVFFL